MTLKQNSSTLASLPLRYRGGAIGMQRAFWGRTEMRNADAGEGITDSLAGVPYGHRHPSAWLLPLSAGALSAFVSSTLSLSAGDLNVASGVNLSGSTSVTFTLPAALLQLVVSASGASSITFSVVGTAAAALSASGSSTVSLTASTATLGAIIDALASAAISFTPSATLRATGNMVGTVTPYPDLSAPNIATAVWERAIEAGFSAEQCLRVLTAVAAGRTDIADLGGGSATVTFRDLANSRDRVVANLTGSERASVTIDAAP